MTATRTGARIARAATVTLAVAAWAVGAWLLARTSVPSLHVSGFDERTFFAGHRLARARAYTRGEDALWLLGTVTTLAALAVLAYRLPQSVRRMGLGALGSAVIVAMVLLVTLWFVRLPFSFASLWWQHHYGLGPFDIAAWLGGQWTGLAAQAIALMLGIVLLVGAARRFPRRWWLVVGPAIVAIGAAFAFVSGYLQDPASRPLREGALAVEAQRLAQIEHVEGTSVRVQDVSSWTNQVNAFTVGFGPSTRVVLWNTLLDGRLSRREVAVVVAHELGHVRSRHIPKAIGWSALVVLPTLFVVAGATRRRGGLGDPANVPLAFLVLAILALLASPIENAVSRRYEAEADWRALNATRDPAAARGLFMTFERTSLEDPDPPTWDYLWLENHPTLMQRIAMTEAWAKRHGKNG